MSQSCKQAVPHLDFVIPFKFNKFEPSQSCKQAVPHLDFALDTPIALVPIVSILQAGGPSFRLHENWYKMTGSYGLNPASRRSLI